MTFQWSCDLLRFRHAKQRILQTGTRWCFQFVEGVTAVTNFCRFCRLGLWQRHGCCPRHRSRNPTSVRKGPHLSVLLTAFLLTLFPYSPDRWSKQRNTTTVSLYSPVLWDLGVLSVQRAWLLAALKKSIPNFPERRIPSRAEGGC